MSRLWIPGMEKKESSMETLTAFIKPDKR